MIWQFFLAHFLADYPLQPDWMAKNKRRPGVLLLHAGIHLLALAALSLPAVEWWPYLLGLAAVHFLIDTGKIWYTGHHPQRVAGPYLLDQGLHLLTILLVSRLSLSAFKPTAMFLPAPVAVIVAGFLLATFVYHVTEQVLSGERVVRSEWGRRTRARMGLRAGLLAVLLLVGNMYPGFTGLPLALVLSLRKEDVRIWLADVLVTAAIAILVIWINHGAGYPA